MQDEMDVNEIDKKMQKKGWNFLGPILHYKKAYKNQASVYEKDGKYVVSGIDSTGKNELFENISKKDAKKKVNDSLKEIRKFMILNSK